MKRTLDFDLSDDDRRVVTVANKSKDYVAVSSVDRVGYKLSGPEKKTADGTAPRIPRILLALLCLILITVVIIVIVVVATNSSDSTTTTTTTMMMTTTMMTTAAPPTTQAPAPPAINVEDTGVPLVELTFLCNHRFDEGPRAGRCISVFSVDNPSGDVVHVDYGANNFVEPGEPNVGQPVSFAAGNRYGGASFEWDCTTHLYARWVLRSGTGTSTATAQRAPVECQPIPNT